MTIKAAEQPAVTTRQAVPLLLPPLVLSSKTVPSSPWSHYWNAAVLIGALIVGLRVLVRQAAGPRPGDLRGSRVRTRAGVHWWLLRWSFALPWRLVTLAVRFAVGAPLGRRRTDATFLRAGTRATELPGWWRGHPDRWAYLPGWARAVVRYGMVGAVVGFALWHGM